MRLSFLTTTIAFAMSVLAFQPRQDLSDPAVASSVYTALSSSGPLSLSSLTSSLDAGFSTETGPIGSITALPSSATPVTSGSSLSVSIIDTVSEGVIPEATAVSSEVPMSTARSGAEQVAFDGLGMTVVSLLFSFWMIL